MVGHSPQKVYMGFSPPPHYLTIQQALLMEYTSCVPPQKHNSFLYLYDTTLHLHNSKTHTETSYQLPLHVLITRWADEDGVLHEADKAPEGVAFILDLSEQGGHQVRHALAVAHVGIKHCIVEQNPPAERTDVLVLL